MALVKDTLKAAIYSAFAEARTKTDNPEEAMNTLADRIATAVDTFVKSGTVSTTVTGTCPAGAVNGTGTGSIS